MEAPHSNQVVVALVLGLIAALSVAVAFVTPVAGSDHGGHEAVRLCCADVGEQTVGASRSPLIGGELGAIGAAIRGGRFGPRRHGGRASTVVAERSQEREAVGQVRAAVGALRRGSFPRPKGVERREVSGCDGIGEAHIVGAGVVDATAPARANGRGAELVSAELAAEDGVLRERALGSRSASRC